MVGGIDNGRQKTRNHGYDVIVWRVIYRLPDHPRKLVTKPKINYEALDTSFFPVAGMPYRKQLGLKDLSPKSQDAVALQQIKERGALPMIDRGDIRQAIDRCSNTLHCRALVMAVEHGADSLIAKFKEAGGTVREIDV